MTQHVRAHVFSSLPQMIVKQMAKKQPVLEDIKVEKWNKKKDFVEN